MKTFIAHYVTNEAPRSTVHVSGRAKTSSAFERRVRSDVEVKGIKIKWIITSEYNNQI